jgi:methyltransferase (TIGR00027 family)
VLAGVGRTALGVAAVRAQESGRPDRLFDDPLAASFVAAVPDAFPGRAERTGEQRSVGAAFAAHAVLRTRFYDDYLLAAGTGQVVLLAAGLDTRAFRLPWPTRPRVFELDLPEVLAFKQTVLDARAATPAGPRITVAADLSSPDWPDRLVAGGFDPLLPTAWLIEGVLIYLTHEAADALLTTVDRLSAPGSRVAFEYRTGATDDLVDRARATSSMAGYAELWQGGLAVDAVDWLRDHGWRPTVHPLAELAVDYGRPLRRTAASSLLDAVRDG